MSIETMSIKSSKKSIDFNVTVLGMEISVPAKTFVINGQEFCPGSDHVVQVGLDSEHDRDVSGFLVKNVSTGAISILHKEIIISSDYSYYKSFDQDGYEQLFLLYNFFVPAGTTDLAGIPISFRRIGP